MSTSKQGAEAVSRGLSVAEHPNTGGVLPLVVVADIHGTHAALRTQLAVLGQPLVVSPWPGEGRPAGTEQEVVAAFHQQDGLARFERKIAEAVGDVPALLLGFSVGASALWRYVASAHCHPNSLAVLYYGSRIRDHAELVPRCRTTICFAEHEASFEPEVLAARLRRPGVVCEVVRGARHGFMNPASCNFHAELAREHCGRLRELLAQA